jgi:Spy/CpxP family protein refolding chaperone
VVLNVVLLGSLILPRSPARPGAESRPVYEQLDLSPEQRARCEAYADTFHAFLGTLGLEIRKKQLELIDALAAPAPRPESIEARREEIQVLQRRMQAHVIAHLLEEREVFTPEQRARFFELIRSRIEAGRAPGPAWVPPGAGRTP